MRILGIAGSLRPHAVSHQVLRHTCGHLRRLGADVRVLDLRAMALPLCCGEHAESYPDWPDVARLRAAARAAEGLLLVTPEYHGSVSGVLKNVLDLLDFIHLEGKVAAGLSVLGGRHNSNALNHLRIILRWCRAWMIPEQIAVERSRRGLDVALASDPELDPRFRDLARSLIQAARCLAAGTVEGAAIRGPGAGWSSLPAAAAPEDSRGGRNCAMMVKKRCDRFATLLSTSRHNGAG